MCRTEKQLLFHVSKNRKALWQLEAKLLVFLPSFLLRPSHEGLITFLLECVPFISQSKQWNLLIGKVVNFAPPPFRKAVPQPACLGQHSAAPDLQSHLAANIASQSAQSGPPPAQPDTDSTLCRAPAELVQPDTDFTLCRAPDTLPASQLKQGPSQAHVTSRQDRQTNRATRLTPSLQKTKSPVEHREVKRGKRAFAHGCWLHREETS